MRFLRRLQYFLHRNELAEEMRQHQEMRQANGEPTRGFGNDLLLRERSRDAWGWLWLEALSRDFRYALRLLRRSPGFAIVAVLSLAIGIGANTAVFSLAEAAYLRPLPVANPGRLFTVYWASLRWGPPGEDSTAQYRDAHGRKVHSVFSYPLWSQWRRDALSVAALAGFQHLDRLDAGIGGAAAQRVLGTLVTGNFDRVVGLAPTLGRGISPGDNQPGAPLVTEISYSFWMSRFGGARDVLGRTVSVDGLPAVIVGVGPRNFHGLEPAYDPAIFLPIEALTGPLGLRAWRYTPKLNDATEWFMQMIGRVQPGVTLAQARAALGLDFSRAVAAMPERPRFGGEKPEFLVEPAANGIDANLHSVAPMAQLLQWLAALVLLIAVVNLANLLLARRAARRPELGLRMAIGAGRAAVRRQLATEGFSLAILGGIAAIAVAALAQQWMRSLPLAALDFGFDWRVLGFTGLVALAVGAVLALAIAWRAPVALQPSLSEAAAPVSGQRLNKVLLAVQVAICLVVLAGAGLFLRTLHNLESVDPGFDPQHIALFRVAPGADGYTDAQRGVLYAELLARLRTLPGVTAAAAVSNPPASGGRDGTRDIALLPGTARNPRTFLETVSPGFLSLYRIPLLEGRDFTPNDDASAPLVAIINREMAKRFTGDPLGQKLYWGKRTLTVVGVAANMTYWRVTAAGAVPVLYRPLAQYLNDTPRTYVALASGASLDALAPGVRAAVAALAPDVPVTNVETQQQAMAGTYFAQQILAYACAGLAIVVLLLAVIGLYGLMAYALVRRTREIGIRMVLGASRASVARLLFGELLLVVGAGVAAGLALTLAVGQLLASLMFHLSPRDPFTLAAAAVLLIVVAALAAALPARRAARLDPALTLRQE